jgi:urease accessory protein
MRTRSRAVIEAGGILRNVSSGPPLTIRRVRHDDASVCRLCLVGTAAGPLSGDDVSLELILTDGARAELVAAGASLAQGRPGGTVATLSTEVSLGARAELLAAPAPVIVSVGSAVIINVRLRMAATATVEWRELLVLGRSAEVPGSVELDWQVERAGNPVLRQRIDLSQPGLVSWPGMLSGQRVLAASFVAGPGVAGRTVVLDPMAVSQQVDEHAVLMTVLASSAADAEFRLDQLRKLVLQ